MLIRGIKSYDRHLNPMLAQLNAYQASKFPTVGGHVKRLEAIKGLGAMVDKLPVVISFIVVIGDWNCLLSCMSTWLLHQYIHQTLPSSFLY